MFKFVPTFATGIKTRFGKFVRLSKCGLNFYIPLIEKIHLVSNRLEQSTFGFEIKTRDNILSNLSVNVQYRIKSEDSYLAYYSFDSHIDKMNSYIKNGIIMYTSDFTLEELFMFRQTISKNLLDHLRWMMANKGYTIENAFVTDIEFNNMIRDSLNAIEASKRFKLSVIEEMITSHLKKITKTGLNFV